MNKGLLIGIVILLVVIGGSVVVLQQKQNNESSPPPQNNATTTAPSDYPGEATITARIDQGASAFGVNIIPLGVTEDSRCPSDVTCIWAGTVRLRALVTYDTGEGEQVFTLGEPVATDGVTILLTDVKPDPVSTRQIAPGEYSFTFTIQKN
ncbi:hypothetical protein L0Y40_01000 [Candidatus Wolfebacteria bacterium]|nr:hypothetical protein [Candidatus Wolfebacteria bacterium]